MKLSAKSVHKFLEDRGWDWADDYGEPGYYIPGDESTPAVVLGYYWINEGDPRYRPTRSTGLMSSSSLSSWFDRYPRLMAQLEEQGVAFEWADEWGVIDGRAYRTQGDSYMWQPSFYESDGERYVLDDEEPDVEHLVQCFVNNPRNAINIHNFDTELLVRAGFERYNGTFESGWYPGQDDDPNAITEAIRRTVGAAEIVFVINGVGQFDMNFTAWVRPAAKPTKTTPSYRTWKGRLEGLITHHQATQFCKAIYTKAMGLPQGGHRCNIQTNEAVALLDQLRNNPVLVVDERRWDKGPDMTTYSVARKWLKSEARRTGMPDLPWDEIVSFYFVDCHVYGSNGWRTDVYPVYEARWQDGTRFCYSPSPWQRGMPKAEAEQKAFWVEGSWSKTLSFEGLNYRMTS